MYSKVLSIKKSNLIQKLRSAPFSLVFKDDRKFVEWVNKGFKKFEGTKN